MTEFASDILWQEALEKYFCDTGEKAHSLGWLHKEAEKRFSHLKTYTELPLICIGVVNGAASIGSGVLFDDPRIASIAVGVTAISGALLGAISSYYGWARRAEAHRIAALQYAKLYRTLALQMSLSRTDRATPAELLRITKETYDRLAEIAPLIPPEVIADYKKRFSGPEYKEIAHPEECNGLEAIKAFHDAANEQPTKSEWRSVSDPARLPLRRLSNEDMEAPVSLALPPSPQFGAGAASTIKIAVTE